MNPIDTLSTIDILSINLLKGHWMELFLACHTGLLPAENQGSIQQLILLIHIAKTDGITMAQGSFYLGTLRGEGYRRHKRVALNACTLNLEGSKRQKGFRKFIPVNLWDQIDPSCKATPCIPSSCIPVSFLYLG